MDDDRIARNEKRIDELRCSFGLFQECGRFHGGTSRRETRKRCARAGRLSLPAEILTAAR